MKYELYLFNSKNFSETTTYDFALDNKKNMRWRDWTDEYKDEFIFFSLDMAVFEELDYIFRKFECFDNYEISEFEDNDLILLKKLLNEEKTNLAALDNSSFKNKFSYLFELINDKEDFLLDYDKNIEMQLLREEVESIFNIWLQHIEKAIHENKIFKIFGI
jgi:hypothetical protein